jgi:hypothetical protein
MKLHSFFSNNLHDPFNSISNNNTLFRLDIIIPFFLSLLGLFEFFDVFKISHPEYLSLSLATQIFFMNTTHVAFSLGLYLFLPEFKNWRTEYSNNKKISIDKELILIHLLIFTLVIPLVFYFGYDAIFDNKAQIFILGSIVPNLHAINQQKGISFLYSRNFLRSQKSDDKICNKIYRLMSFEKNLFSLFVCIVVLRILLQSIPQLKELNVFWYNLIISVLIWCALLIFILILSVALMQNKHLKSTKPFFTFRLLSWFLCPLVFLGNIGVMASHGIEAHMVFKKIVSKSKITPSQLRELNIFLTLFFVALTFLISVSFLRFLNTNYFSGEFWIVAYLLVMVFSYAHYWIDHKIFNFKNNLNLKYISPLLEN